MKKTASAKSKKVEPISRKKSEIASVLQPDAAPKVEAVRIVETSDDVVLHVLSLLLDETIEAVRHHARLIRSIEFTIQAMTNQVYTIVYMGTAILHDGQLVEMHFCENEVIAVPLDRCAVLSLPRKEASKSSKLLIADSGGPKSLLRTHSEKSIARTAKKRSLAAYGGLSNNDPLHSRPQEVPIITRLPSPKEIMTEEMRRWRRECMEHTAVAKHTKSRWNHVTLLRRVMTTVHTDPDDIIELVDAIPPQPTVAPATVAIITERKEPETDLNSLLYLPTAKGTGVPVYDPDPPKVEETKTQKYIKGYNNRFHRISIVEAKKPTKAVNWFYDRGSTDNEFKNNQQAYQPLLTELQRGNFPQSVDLNPGVSLVHGAARFTGPSRQESPHSMSRKDFEKHLNQANTPPQSNKVKLTSLSTTSPVSALSETPRSEPSTGVTPTPRRKSISENTTDRSHSDAFKLRSVKLPQQHINNNVAIRVRVSALKADTPNARPSQREKYVTHGDSVGVLDIPKRRPATAIGALTRTTTCSNESTKHKYIREFPKPKAEVVTVTKDAKQKMAWLG